MSPRFVPHVTALLAALLAASAPTDAQILRRPQAREPIAWGSLSAGYLQLQGIYDGTTNTAWNFGPTLQYRASLEKATRNESGVGLTATLAAVPLTYSDDGSSPDGCGRCDAHARLWSLEGFFHAGGGLGLHQVIEVRAGVLVFDTFRADDTDTALRPLRGDPDFTFGIAYGLGYSLSPRASITLVQEYGAVVHQRTGLSGGDSNISQQHTTRVGFRYGLGTRPAF